MRPGWNPYFLSIAKAVSERADCTRRKVGAVVVDRQHRIVATGYNGTYPGGLSCLLGECPRGLRSKEEVPPDSDYTSGSGLCIASHAEANALLYAGLDKTVGAFLYITDEPCHECRRLIMAAQIGWVVWGTPEKYEYLDVYPARVI